MESKAWFVQSDHGVRFQLTESVVTQHNSNVPDDRADHFSEGGQNNFDSCSPESVLIPRQH